jgi:hypothetical protein
MNERGGPRDIAGVPLDPSRHLSEDCALEFCRHIECGLALRRLLATCKFFQRLLRRGPNAPAEAVWAAAWLPISSSNAPHVLKHAPAGERIRILAGTTLSGQIVCGHALHVRAEPGVKLVGCLYLQGGASGSAASRGEEAIPGWLFGGLEQAREGLLEGLAISHYMEAAVLVRGGSWLLRECTITSSRRARSVTAVHLREAGCLRLERCLISNAAHAVSLDPGCCALVAAECTFERCKAAVLTRGGGCVIIERSTLNANEQALKLDDLVQVIATVCPGLPWTAMAGERPQTGCMHDAYWMLAFVCAVGPRRVRCLPPLRSLPFTPSPPSSPPSFPQGHAEGNVLNCSMFGQWVRPVGFRCRANTYPDDGSNADESASGTET